MPAVCRFRNERVLSSAAAVALSRTVDDGQSLSSTADNIYHRVRSNGGVLAASVDRQQRMPSKIDEFLTDLKIAFQQCENAAANPTTEVCRSLPTTTEVCRLPPTTTELCRSPPTMTDLCRRAPTTTELCRPLPTTPEVCRLSPTTTNVCRLSLTSTELYCRPSTTTEVPEWLSKEIARVQHALRQCTDGRQIDAFMDRVYAAVHKELMRRADADITSDACQPAATTRRYGYGRRRHRPLGVRPSA